MTPQDMTIHAIVGRARRLGLILLLAGAALALAAKRQPDMPYLKWIALFVLLIGATLMLAAITHRMLFRKIEIVASREPSETPDRPD